MNGTKRVRVLRGACACILTGYRLNWIRAERRLFCRTNGSQKARAHFTGFDFIAFAIDFSVCVADHEGNARCKNKNFEHGEHVDGIG